MLLRGGLLLSFAAVLLQIAVFLQPLLPEQYQVAPVCETITRALITPEHDHHAHTQQHDHDANHQCQYCTVYGNLVLPPELSVKEVLDRIQVRLVAWQRSFAHVWFVLQRLFLIPQGRAPPLSA